MTNHAVQAPSVLMKVAFQDVGLMMPARAVRFVWRIGAPTGAAVMRLAQRDKFAGMRCVERAVEVMKPAPKRTFARMRFVASAAAKTRPVLIAKFVWTHAVRRVVGIMKPAA